MIIYFCLPRHEKEQQMLRDRQEREQRERERQRERDRERRQREQERYGGGGRYDSRNYCSSNRGHYSNHSSPSPDHGYRDVKPRYSQPRSDPKRSYEPNPYLHNPTYDSIHTRGNSISPQKSRLRGSDSNNTKPSASRRNYGGVRLPPVSATSSVVRSPDRRAIR